VSLATAVLVSAAVLAAATVWATLRIVEALRESRRDGERTRIVQLLATFGPAVHTANADPRALLSWLPVARAARTVLPDEFAALDRAAGRSFPFSREQTEAAHAAWTTSWLTWERQHDADYRLKAQTLAEALGADAASSLGRSRLEAIEREKVERYQQRYEEYTRVAKALQRLESGS
jgi:hypothetical protein